MSEQPTTRLFVIKDALADGLAARPGMASVYVGTGWMAGTQPPEEWLILLDASAPQEYGAMGGAGLGLDEAGQIDGQLQVSKSGAGEDVLRAARERAAALLGELELLLAEDRTVGGLVSDIRLGNLSVRDEPADQARLCLVTFSLAYRARIYPGG